jgi:hypothetical protein
MGAQPADGLGQTSAERPRQPGDGSGLIGQRTRFDETGPDSMRQDIYAWRTAVSSAPGLTESRLQAMERSASARRHQRSRLL